MLNTSDKEFLHNFYVKPISRIFSKAACSDYTCQANNFFFFSQAYVLLSGLSPFAGSTDLDTLKNVKACSWVFDEEAFMNVSEEGKDFIRKLLIKQKEKRMNAHECLQHAWLTGDHR